MTRRSWGALLLMTLAVVSGCHDGPPEILWNVDSCDFCRMTITDGRSAAAAVTAGGRTVKFDAIECLAGWVEAQQDAPQAIWVADAAHPGTLIPAGSAVFYRSSGAHSPMGRNFFASTGATDPMGGAPLSWAEVRALVRREGALPDSAARSTP